MKNKPFSITNLNKGSKGQTIVFEGDLGIKYTEAIRNTLKTLKFNSDIITLQLKNVEKLDITTIQNIRALRDALSGRGKKVTVTSELSQDIERLLLNTGFDNTL